MTKTSEKAVKAVSAAPKKRAVKKDATKRPVTPPLAVTLDGEPAKNRHFLIDVVLVEAATTKAEEDQVSVSDVLRYGVREYGATAPAEDAEVVVAANQLPSAGLRTLAALWRRSKKKNDPDLINQYLAALHRAGWSTRAIAESIVAAECAESFTRQAVNLRVLKAPDELREDLPAVPTLGPRRPMLSSKSKTKRIAKHDLTFRVKDEEYAAAKRRSVKEGAMMSSVLENVLLGYTNGEFDDDLDVIRGYSLE